MGPAVVEVSPMNDRPQKPYKPNFRPPAGAKGRRDHRPRRQAPGGDRSVIYGWHPVVEALRNRHRDFHRLLATENSARRLTEEVGPLPIDPEIVRPSEISKLVEPDAVHQGLYLEADPLPSPTLDTLSGERIVLALDQITDPHNVGAIVRSAAAFDVEAIVTTARHSPAATGVLAKAASGGLEHVPFLIVGNLAEALIALGKRGFQRIGLDSTGAVPLDGMELRRPTVLVMGSEGASTCPAPFRASTCRTRLRSPSTPSLGRSTESDPRSMPDRTGTGHRNQFARLRVRGAAAKARRPQGRRRGRSSPRSPALGPETRPP
jgi:23S rRNA (guanosine2251-2'-O)-methyltransferase